MHSLTFGNFNMNITDSAQKCRSKFFSTVSIQYK